MQEWETPAFLSAIVLCEGNDDQREKREIQTMFATYHHLGLATASPQTMLRLRARGQDALVALDI